MWSQRGKALISGDKYNPKHPMADEYGYYDHVLAWIFMGVLILMVVAIIAYFYFQGDLW